MDPRSDAAARFSRATRVPLETVVRLHFEGQVAYQNGFAANVSATGMFVKHPEPHAEGAKLVFEFVVGRGRKPVQGSGEIVWVRPKYLGPGQPAGMGIAFDHLDVQSRENLAEALFEFLEESLGAENRDAVLPEEAEATATAVSSPEVLTVPPDAMLVDAEEAPLPRPTIEPFRLGFSGDEDLEAVALSEPSAATLAGPAPLPPSVPSGPEATWSLAAAVPDDETEAQAPLGDAGGAPATLDGWHPDRDALVPEPSAARTARAYNLEEGITGPRRKAAWRGPAIAAAALALAAGAWYLDLLGLRGAGGPAAPPSKPPASADTARTAPAAPKPAAPTPGGSPNTAVPAGSATGDADAIAATGSSADPSTPSTAPAPSVPAKPLPDSTAARPPAASEMAVPVATTNAGAAAAPAARFRTVRDITWSAAGNATVVVVETDGAIVKGDFAYAPMSGESPRVLLRLFDVAQPFGKNRLEARTPQLRAIRTGYHAGTRGNDLHVVLDLDRVDPRLVTVTAEGNRLILHCGG